MKRSIILIIVLIIGLTPLAILSFQTNIPHPETIEEAQELGGNMILMIPGFLQDGLKNARSVWTNIFHILKRPWDHYVMPWINKGWRKINEPFKNYVENKKDTLEQDLKKEEDQIKENTKQVSKSVWQKILEKLKK